MISSASTYLRPSPRFRLDMNEASRRDLLMTLLLAIAAALLAVALFVAGAIWRGRAAAAKPRISNTPRTMQDSTEPTGEITRTQPPQLSA
jgi:hypothetical protein